MMWVQVVVVTLYLKLPLTLVAESSYSCQLLFIQVRFSPITKCPFLFPEENLNVIRFIQIVDTSNTGRKRPSNFPWIQLGYPVTYLILSNLDNPIKNDELLFRFNEKEREIDKERKRDMERCIFLRNF